MSWFAEPEPEGGKGREDVGRRYQIGSAITEPSPDTSSLHRSVYSSNSSHSIPPVQSRLQRLSHSAEAWFGSLERFESSLVHISRLGIVDCVTYPFIAFSHQCQFYPYYPVNFSLTAPFSTVVVMHHIMSSQSVSALWRGWKSHVLLLFVRPFLDAILTKLIGGDKTSGNHNRVGDWIKTLLTKSLPHLVTMPLLSYHYLEVAETTKDKLQGGRNVMEMFDRPMVRKDGFRRVPFLVLATPTVLHCLLKGGVSHIIYKLFGRLWRRTEHKHLPTSAVEALWLDYCSLFLTDFLLYPLETILVRLYCQGMPALVDNVQNGSGLVLVSTYYTGVLDCVTGLWDSEGLGGFFRGFSSVLIRYSIHGLILVLLWRTAQTLENRLKR